MQRGPPASICRAASTVTALLGGGKAIQSRPHTRCLHAAGKNDVFIKLPCTALQWPACLPAHGGSPKSPDGRAHYCCCWRQVCCCDDAACTDQAQTSQMMWKAWHDTGWHRLGRRQAAQGQGPAIAHLPPGCPAQAAWRTALCTALGARLRQLRCSAADKVSMVWLVRRPSSRSPVHCMQRAVSSSSSNQTNGPHQLWAALPAWAACSTSHSPVVPATAAARARAASAPLAWSQKGRHCHRLSTQTNVQEATAKRGPATPHLAAVFLQEGVPYRGPLQQRRRLVFTAQWSHCR